MEVIKKDVEELLHYAISDELFAEALEVAKRKRQYIYEREKREVILKHWYLVKLTEEAVRSLTFSKFTMDLCSMLRDMEKEHSVKDQSAHTDNHIVAVSAL